VIKTGAEQDTKVVEQPTEEAEAGAEQDAETMKEEISEGEPETTAETKVVTEAEPEMKSEADDKGAIPGDGFILAEAGTEIDVDASGEGSDLEPDREESRFQIEEEKKEEIPEVKDEMTEVEDEITEPVTSREPEPEVEEDEIDKARAAEVARALAREKAELLASRQERKPAPPSPPPPPPRKKVWPWIAGFIALLAALLAVGWFLFPEQVDRFLKQDGKELTIGEAPVAEKESPGIEEEAETVDMEEITGESSQASGPAGTPETGDTDGAEPGTGNEEAGEASGPSPGGEKESPVRAPAGKQYHVIAGSFASLSNAREYLQLLRTQGYDAAIIGERNHLHTVCFSSHATRQEAQEELRRIRRDRDPEAWILFY
jgi:cell division septation protein DedD